MCHAVRSHSNFHALLRRFDEQIAEDVRAQGCPHCAGVLHRADYPRKPWGVSARSGVYYERRLSLCCDGCRRRCTPPTVRFFGRRRYIAMWAILLSALSQGVTGRRGERLRQALGVSRRTMTRWRRWWREHFVATAFWRAARGRVGRALEALPGDLLEAFDGTTRRQRLLHTLLFLAPLSANRSHYAPVGPGPQTLTVGSRP